MGTGSWRAGKGRNGRGQRMRAGPEQARGRSAYVVWVQDHQLGPVVFRLVAALRLRPLQGAFLRPAWQPDAVQEGGLASFPGVGVRLLQGVAWGTANAAGSWQRRPHGRLPAPCRAWEGGRKGWRAGRGQRRGARHLLPAGRPRRASPGTGPVSKAGRKAMYSVGTFLGYMNSEQRGGLYGGARWI